MSLGGGSASEGARVGSPWQGSRDPLPLVAPQAGTSLPSPARRRLGAWPWVFAGLAVLIVPLLAYFAFALGISNTLIAMIVATIPFAGVLFAVRLVDRWEPEPKRWVVFAVCWGAIVAVVATLLVDLGLSYLLGYGWLRDATQGLIQAPVVEEVTKGLGLLIVFRAGKRALDGPLDGVVYGALIGAGFAFTENIQYFAVSLIEGGVTDLTAVFFLRAILSPFAHAMFTAVTGLALGFAARRGHRVHWAGPFLLGLFGAVLLHALWNGSAMFGDFYELYVSLQIPLFLGSLLGVLLLRRDEERHTRARLAEYATAGWFTPEEVTMLATRRGRRAAVAWARGLRGDRSRLMRGFIADAAELAAIRQRIASGRDPGAVERERELLAQTARTRQALLAY